MDFNIIGTIIPINIPTTTSFSVWCFLTRIASCHTITENARQTANITEANPETSPTEVQSALTNAECALGIPPHLKNDFFVLEKKYLLACAMNQAIKTLNKINFMQLLLRYLQNSLA